MSHAALVFLDDGISGHGTKVDASAASLIQQKDLLSAGFTPNAAKCDWEPRQLGEWLGILINTIRMCFQISPRKIAKTKFIISHILTSNHVIIRDIAKIAGFINSLYLAVGPATRLFTRHMHFAIMQRNSWDSTISINEVLREELRFWYTNIHLFQGYHIKPPIATYAAVYTDASGTGYGGYTVPYPVTPYPASGTGYGGYTVHLAPKRLSNIFHETPSSRHYNLRGSSTKLCLPQPKTDYLKNSLSYRGAKLWNSLSDDIRNKESLPAFKTSIRAPGQFLKTI